MDGTFKCLGQGQSAAEGVCDGYELCSASTSFCVAEGVPGRLTPTCQCRNGFEKVDGVCKNINGT